MQLKQRVMDPRQRDDISEALAYMEQPRDGEGNPSGEPYRVVPSYFHNYYPKGLKEQTVGENSRQHVGVTRFYPTLKPRVVVDFEPAPPEKFWEDEKRRLFVAEGIVYVPIHLGDRMDEAGFKERVAAATTLMQETQTYLHENAALKEPELSVEGWLCQPELMALLDARALREVEDEIKAGKRLFGVAKHYAIRTRKEALLRDLRDGLRSNRIVDPYECYREPASTPE